MQRVRLATCIGTGLVGIWYILDEPSIRVHQRDNDRLIESLRDLQMQGNTVIVVEHDEAMMRAADVLVDMGPGAGRLGGQIVALGTPEQVLKSQVSITADYLSGRKLVSENGPKRLAKKNKRIRLTGASLHNLLKVDVEIPVGLLVGLLESAVAERVPDRTDARPSHPSRLECIIDSSSRSLCEIDGDTACRQTD